MDCNNRLNIIGVMGKMVFADSTMLIFYFNLNLDIRTRMISMCVKYFNNENKSHQAE